MSLVLENIEFEYSISNITVENTSTIYYTFQATRPSKVVCLSSRSDSDVDKLIWNQPAHYFHSSRSYTEHVDVNGIAGQDYRLFCKITDLSTEEYNSTYFRGNPFSIHCIALITV